MSVVLSQSEVERRLAAFEEWRQVGSKIRRTVVLPGFPAALMFAGAVGHLAEKADHHPDILVQYRQVTLTLSTHSVGGLTDKDFALAAQIDAIA